MITIVISNQLKNYFRKNQKAFTLIELLAVIVILGIIMSIAIMAVSGVINNSKISAYNKQKELIEDAARLYHTSGYLNFIDNQAVVTVGELQSQGLLESNIKDPRTGSKILLDRWVLISKSNDSYTYNYGYETDGLLLHYDAVYNGGVNTHNNNASVNKGIWKDLSGNNNDCTLLGFDFNIDSGWDNSSLNFDGVNDWCLISQMNYDYMTLEAVYSVSDTSTKEKTIIGNIESGGIMIQPMHRIKASAYVSGNYRDMFGQTVIANKLYKTTISFDGKNVTMYDDNTVSKLSVEGVIKPPANNTVFILGANPSGNAFANDYTPGKISSIRIYNRALTADEVMHNYEIDKLRFGL